MQRIGLALGVCAYRLAKNSPVQQCIPPLHYAQRCRGLPSPLQWRHNEHHGGSNHRDADYLLNRLFRRTSKKILKLRVTSLYYWNPPVTSGFPSQRSSNAENVSNWWRHRAHEMSKEFGEIPSHHTDLQVQWHIIQLMLVYMVSVILQWFVWFTVFTPNSMFLRWLGIFRPMLLVDSYVIKVYW